MTTLRLLADDLTGALDSAAELVGLTGPVPVFWHGALPAALPAGAALDSGTRELPPEAASAVVGALATTLRGADIAFKKIDSLLRGPTVAEIAACLRSGFWDRAVLAPAFPYQGRITRGGIQYARDVVGGWSPAGGDLVEALRAACIEAQYGRYDAALPLGVSVFDAEDDTDLDRISATGRAANRLLWIGTGGLAQALGRAAPPPAAPPLRAPVLGLFGSDHAVTAAQLAACGADWLHLPHDIPAAPAIAAQLEASGRVAVSLDLPHGLARDEAARRISAALHDVVRTLPPPGTLVVAGGETLRGLCIALGAHHLDLVGRIVPGLPCSIIRGGAWDGLTVVSKSGAFGHPALLRDLLRDATPPSERTE